MSRRIFRALVSLAVPVLLAGGCGQSRKASSAIGQFHHQAPHGGAIVGLGDDYNLELVRDASSGTLSAYVFDDDMENFIRISATSITLLADTGGVVHRLVLEAVANLATGETAGNTSLFQARADWLKTAPRFHAELPLVNVRGTDFKNISFDFPEGSDKD